ncbi:hypothetical protein AB0B57_22365 [Micromonospora sp. NPDC049101]|uniref:hypothetical protein n=1 Tax=Micromonospora sp. NPDC049101 TaxID=3155032 RepID=UPI0033DAFD05
MTGFMKYVGWLKDNPVIVTDIIKYVIAALTVAGVTVNAAIAAPIGGAVLLILTLITRSQVVSLPTHNAAVEDALNTPAPEPTESGEADYVASITDDAAVDSGPWFTPTTR